MQSKLRSGHSFSLLKKAIILSSLVGLLFSALLGGGSALFFHHQRADAWDILNRDINQYMAGLFHDLKGVSGHLQPLAFMSCEQVSRKLTANAAFTANVRAFLLVKDGVAWCSSATGEMSEVMASLDQDLDVSKPVDVDILPGTPMMPHRPAISLWFQNPMDPTRGIFTTININLTPYLLYTARQRDVTGIAILAKGKALSTFSPQVTTIDEIHHDAIRASTLEGYPIEVRLYGEGLSTEDIQLSILVGLLSGVAMGLLCGYLFFTTMKTSKEIQTGIRRGQFFVVYQPVVDCATEQVLGVEALMRWKHPVNGLIPPDAFISFAEAQKLIAPLTRHLFELILRDLQSLAQVLPKGGKLGINLAPGHLHEPDFKQDILAFSRAFPDDHFQIVFEITERTMLNEKQALPVFEWLHEQGFEIAIDDFGTGHSALIYLQRFKMDYLKIDRGFVNTIGMDTVTAPVLDAVLTLARRLHMTTVAEGVETREQAQWLIDQGVDFMQGYYYSRPLSIEALKAWTQQHLAKSQRA